MTLVIDYGSESAVGKQRGLVRSWLAADGKLDKIVARIESAVRREDARKRGAG